MYDAVISLFFDKLFSFLMIFFNYFSSSLNIFAIFNIIFISKIQSLMYISYFILTNFISVCETIDVFFPSTSNILYMTFFPYLVLVQYEVECCDCISPAPVDHQYQANIGFCPLGFDVSMYPSLKLSLS